jgi:hypothetical protein
LPFNPKNAIEFQQLLKKYTPFVSPLSFRACHFPSVIPSLPKAGEESPP